MQSDLVIQLPTAFNVNWERSSIFPLLQQSGQFKNKIAARVVEQSLQENQIPCVIDEYNNVKFGSNYQSEVKIAFAKFKGNKREFWFNQIHPNVNNWTHIHLMCVHPEMVEVYQFTKEECLQLCEDASGLSHTGQEGDLLAVHVHQTENGGTYWKLDCYGTLLTNFSTNKLKLINNATE
jgi:hypothetical protein